MRVGNFREIVFSVNKKYIIIQVLVSMPRIGDGKSSATADKNEVTLWGSKAIKAQGIRLTY
jgi:hypothetical protein